MPNLQIMVSRAMVCFQDYSNSRQVIVESIEKKKRNDRFWVSLVIFVPMILMVLRRFVFLENAVD